MKAVIQVDFTTNNKKAVYVLNFSASDSHRLITIAKKIFNEQKIQVSLTRENLLIRTNNESMPLHNERNINLIITNSKKLIEMKKIERNIMLQG